MRASILFLSNAYPDFDSSYRGHFIKTMATQLQKDGYHISVITPKIYKRSRYSELQRGIKVYRFPFFAENRLLIEYKKIPYLKMLLYYFSGFIITFYILLRRRYDLIHIHWVIPTGLIGMVAAFFLRKPYIVTIHGSDFRMAMEGPSILRKVFFCICRRAKHIIGVSEIQRKELESRGVNKEKISVLPMSVDENFLKIGKKREISLGNGHLTILSNRNLLPIYNVALLIRAIPMIIQEEPQTRFLIAGDGPEREQLAREATRLNVNNSIKFLGRVPHEEMADLLGQVDIYVSTSLYDGTSVSLLEAMASGAFPVVTDIPSNREWILNAKNGFLVSPNVVESLAKKIIEAIRNEKLRKEASEQNIKIIRLNANWRKQIDTFVNIYKNSLKQNRLSDLIIKT